MRGKHHQTCQCCGAGPLTVETIPDDLRRFFSLRVKHGCRKCIGDLRAEKRRLWGPPAKLEQEAA